MISKMAMADIEALRADGIDVPPREVVRLNALGLRVERGPESADLFAAPRVAFVGDVVIREPSLGAEMWLRQALDAFDGDDEQTYFTLRVLSCVVPWRELPDPADQKAVRKAIKATLKRLSDATLRQLDNALEWCIGGNLPETGEKPPPRPVADDSSAADAEDMPERYSPEFGLFYRGMAVRIGTAADILASRKNKGEAFEQWVTENAGQEWHKDSVPYYMDGDLTVNGVKYQIKFESASLANETTIAKAMARA